MLFLAETRLALCAFCFEILLVPKDGRRAVGWSPGAVPHLSVLFHPIRDSPVRFDLWQCWYLFLLNMFIPRFWLSLTGFIPLLYTHKIKKRLLDCERPRKFHLRAQ